MDDIVDILNDTSSESVYLPSLTSSPLHIDRFSITFFATPDEALRCPHHDKATGEDEYDLITSKLSGLCDAHHAIENLETLDLPEKKKFLKKVIRAVLLYHILPSSLNSVALTNNNTFATKLILPDSLDQRPLRIRVVTKGFVPPIAIINFHSRVIQPNIPATNGENLWVAFVFHPSMILDQVSFTKSITPSFPLRPFLRSSSICLPYSLHSCDLSRLPFPSEMFLIIDLQTSAIQRAELTDYLDFRFVRKSEEDHGKESFVFRGSPAVTVFAPTNAAFEELPWKLRRFLFSPFGRRVLRKLLEYHIVPDYIFHTGKFTTACAPGSTHHP